MADPKKVILVAMIEPFEGDADGAEIWGVNRSYKVQKAPHAPLTRLYFTDNLSAFADPYIDDVNALDIPIYSRQVYTQIKNSRKLPLQEIIDYFNGIKYFGSTPAYMLAHAIMEGFTDITLQGMYYFGDSMEYMEAKPCMDFWCGVAVGKGCKVTTGEGCALCQPFPWQPALYGYYKNMNDEICNSTITAAYKACTQYPRCIVPNDEKIEEAVKGRRKVITHEAAETLRKTRDSELVPA